MRPWRLSQYRGEFKGVIGQDRIEVNIRSTAPVLRHIPTDRDARNERSLTGTPHRCHLFWRW